VQFGDNGLGTVASIDIDKKNILTIQRVQTQQVMLQAYDRNHGFTTSKEVSEFPVSKDMTPAFWDEPSDAKK